MTGGMCLEAEYNLISRYISLHRVPYVRRRRRRDCVRVKNPLRFSMRLSATTFFMFLFISVSSGQDRERPANTAAELPNILVLVHQEVQHGKASTREKLELAMKRACDRLNVPNSWIDLQAVTGPPEILFFDAFDSFDHLEQTMTEWAQLNVLHPELARLQEEIDTLVTNERTIIAARREDLGYRPETIDLSEARFIRVHEVRLFPGHESDFVETLKLLRAAYEKTNSNTPWAVYQANMGTQYATFLIFTPLIALQEIDDLLAAKDALRDAEGADGEQRLQQIAREAYASAESTLYVVHPQTSHVPKEFAARNPDFWSPKTETEAKQPRR